MTAPDSRDSVERVVAEMREELSYSVHAVEVSVSAFRAWVDRLQALARGPQQAGGEDVPEKVVAWMNEREAWRSPRAPSEPGTHALVLADDYAALQAEVARLLGQNERLASAVRDTITRAEAAEAALREAGRDAERYRWLRDKAPDTWDVSRWLDKDTQEIHLQDDLDAAIDAALNGGQDDA